MFKKCANLDCKRPFDYREGQLVRFSRDKGTVRTGSSVPAVEHYWICGNCFEHYVLRPEPESIRLAPRYHPFHARAGQSYAAALGAN